MPPVSRICTTIAAVTVIPLGVHAERLKRPTRKFGAPRGTRDYGLHVPNSFPILVLLRVGLPCLEHYWRSGALLPHLFTLTQASRASQLCRSLTGPRRYILCGTFRKVSLNSPSGRYPPLLCGVRTFLCLGRAAREIPASATQTATSGPTSIPYYKMISGGQGFTQWP